MNSSVTFSLQKSTMNNTAKSSTSHNTKDKDATFESMESAIKEYEKVFDVGPIFLNDIRVECTKHRYYEFIEAEENIHSIIQRQEIISGNQLRSAQRKIIFFGIIAGFGVFRFLSLSAFDQISIGACFLGLTGLEYVYYKSYRKASIWLDRFGGYSNLMNYLDESCQSSIASISENPHGQILHVVRSKQRERIAQILNFYGLGGIDDMKMTTERAYMIDNRDKVGLRTRLSTLKGAIELANKNEKSLRDFVQNAKKSILTQNFKVEATVLMKYLEIIIEREELCIELLKTKKAKSAVKALD